MDNISKIFPNMVAELDEDLGNVRIQPDSQQQSQEDELLEYFGRFNLEGSECTTPISGPEIAVSNLESSEKKTIDIEHMSSNLLCESDENIEVIEKKLQDKATSPINLFNQYPTEWYSKLKNTSIQSGGQAEKDKNLSYKSNFSEVNYIANSSRNTSSLGSDKWVSEKEKFLDSVPVRNENIVDNTNKKENQKLGTVTVKESFIELPRIGRISKSFHGKSPSKDSYLDIELTPRRASDNMVNLTSTLLNSKPLNLKHTVPSQTEKSKPTRPKFYTQKSQPCPIASKEEFRKSSLSEPQNLKGARFTTTLVDESMFLEGLKSSSIPNKINSEKKECD